jgi:hypothetical protein
MGRIVTPVRVTNLLHPECELLLDALVDTGAFGLTLSSAWKARLGELPVVREVELETDDNRVIRGEVCGPVMIRIAGFDKIVGEAVFVDVPPVDGEYEPLLGYIPLEQSQAAVDMAGHRLVKIRPLDLK